MLSPKRSQNGATKTELSSKRSQNRASPKRRQNGEENGSSVIFMQCKKFAIRKPHFWYKEQEYIRFIHSTIESTPKDLVSLDLDRRIGGDIDEVVPLTRPKAHRRHRLVEQPGRWQRDRH